MSNVGHASPRLFAVVLAAGAARRFGDSKLLAHHAGQPLVRRALRTAEAVCQSRTVLVVGHDRKRVLEACAPIAGFFVINERFESGMSTSIVRAVGALPATAEAMLLVLADQPLVTADDLAVLVSEWQQHPGRIVCSRFDETLSPPVVFPSDRFAALESLRGDRGARGLLERHRQDVVAVDLPAAALDVDTPQDLERLPKEC